MNELSTEVKAKEIHEKAVGYFKVSEQYGYKFIMEVKKIRDDRYYKELGFNTFEDYCQSAWGFSRQWMNAKIQSASNLNEEDFDKYTFQIGQQKTFLLATMEDEQREQATEKGIPTKEGYKSIDKATQKEINEYKRNADEAEKRAKQAESQAEIERKERERLELENEELANVEPEIIEVVPDDYDFYKGNYESAVNLQKRYKEQMEEMRNELNSVHDELKQERYKITDDEAEEKEKQVKIMMLDASKSVLQTKIDIDEFMQKVAVTSYRRGAIAASSENAKKKIREGIDDLKNFISEMEMALDGTIEQDY